MSKKGFKKMLRENRIPVNPKFKEETIIKIAKTNKQLTTHFHIDMYPYPIIVHEKIEQKPKRSRIVQKRFKLSQFANA